LCVLPFCMGGPALADALRCWGVKTKRPSVRHATVAVVLEGREKVSFEFEFEGKRVEFFLFGSPFDDKEEMAPPSRGCGDRRLQAANRRALRPFRRVLFESGNSDTRVRWTRCAKVSSKGRMTSERETSNASPSSSDLLTPSDDEVDVAERLGRDGHAPGASLAGRCAERGGGAGGEGAVHRGLSGEGVQSWRRKWREGVKERERSKR